eukprot:scaffold2534_cov260-Pinguiococcus_pyrenoidosus.AAC.14
MPAFPPKRLALDSLSSLEPFGTVAIASRCRAQRDTTRAEYLRVRISASGSAAVWYRRVDFASARSC